MLRTIRTSGEIDGLFAAGTRKVSKHLVVIAAPTPEGRGPDGRVAFLAGRKLGNAVVRNRAKRVLRESARRLGGAWPGFDVALIARPTTALADSGDLDEQLTGALAFLGVIEP